MARGDCPRGSRCHHVFGGLPTRSTVSQRSCGAGATERRPEYRTYPLCTHLVCSVTRAAQTTCVHRHTSCRYAYLPHLCPPLRHWGMRQHS